MEAGDEGALAPIGRALLEVVRQRWPELLDHASVSSEGDLVIELASPHSANAPTLWLSADAHSDEVIIAMGGGHSHGGPWQSQGDPDHRFASSIAFLEAIFREEVVGCTLKVGGAIGNLANLREQPYWGDVTSIRSWKGTHDWP